MLMVTAEPTNFDFFLQEPGEVIEHDRRIRALRHNLQQARLEVRAVERIGRMGGQHSRADLPFVTEQAALLNSH